MNLLEDLVRGRDRFHEHRDVVGHRIGNRIQVGVGKTKELCKGAVAPDNSQHCAIGTPRSTPWRAASSKKPTTRWDSHSRPCVSRDRKTPDRKSTRLNSSHLGISYAVFCL